MAMHPRRPVARAAAPKQSAPQHVGPFLGTAQAGAARRQRAHALAEELLARGCMYLQKQVWEEAAREFDKAIQMEPDYAEAFNNLGLCQLYQNKNAEAVESLRQAVDLFPEWHIALANLGLALQHSGKNEEAVGYYEKTLHLSKTQPAVWLSLGDAYSALGKLDKAVQAYETVLQLSPKNYVAHSRLGLLMARRNQIDEAETSLRAAVELEPDNPDALAVLGAISACKGDLSTARDYFMQVMDREKVPAPAQRGMNRLQIFRKGLEKAFGEWKQTMPEPKPIAELYYELGIAHVAGGSRESAKAAFQNAADSDPQWPLPLIWFGFFAALDGDATSAGEYWRKAAALEPDNAMLHEQLGYLSIGMGIQKEAEGWFAKALKLGRQIPQEDMQPDAGSRVQPAVK
ncbi:MAG TPA: tetratricopeptide repeat protein [Planctomycetota bacterium]|jgi:superkiller protein 3